LHQSLRSASLTEKPGQFLSPRTTKRFHRDARRFIHIYDEADKVIETQEKKGQFDEW
jgi:hypothetical protein